MLFEEKLVIDEIRKGNSAVYEKLFNEQYEVLVNYALHFLGSKDLAEDVVQGVFVYVWENSKSIYVERSLESYLFRAVKNRSLNHLRKIQIRDKHQLLYLEAVLEINEKHPDWNSDLIDEVKKALNLLPPQMYKIFCQKYLSEESIKDIATKFSLSENTVKVQLHKGRNLIRKHLLDTTKTLFFL